MTKEVFDLRWQHPDDPAFGPKNPIYTCGWICHMCNWTIDSRNQNLMDPNLFLKHANIKHGIVFGTEHWTMLMSCAMFLHRPSNNVQLPEQLTIPPVVPPTPPQDDDMNERGGSDSMKNLIAWHKENSPQPREVVIPPNAHHIQRFDQWNISPSAFLGSGPLDASRHPARISSEIPGTTSHHLDRISNLITRINPQFPNNPISDEFITALPRRRKPPTPQDVVLPSVDTRSALADGQNASSATEAQAQAQAQSRIQPPGQSVNDDVNQGNGNPPTVPTFGPTPGPATQPHYQTSDDNMDSIREDGEVLESTPSDPNARMAYTTPPPRSYATVMIGMEDYRPKPEDLLCEAYMDFHAPYRQLENPLVVAERGERLPQVHPPQSDSLHTSGFKPQPYQPERFGGDPEPPLTEARRLRDEQVITNMSRRAYEGPKYNGPPHELKKHIPEYTPDYVHSLTERDINLLKNFHAIKNTQVGRPLQGFNLCSPITTQADLNLTVDPVHGTLFPARYSNMAIDIGMRSLNDSHADVIASRKSCLAGAIINSNTPETGSDANVNGTGHGKGSSNSRATQENQEHVGEHRSSGSTELPDLSSALSSSSDGKVAESPSLGAAQKKKKKRAGSRLNTELPDSKRERR